MTSKQEAVTGKQLCSFLNVLDTLCSPSKPRNPTDIFTCLPHRAGPKWKQSQVLDGSPRSIRGSRPLNNSWNWYFSRFLFSFCSILQCCMLRCFSWMLYCNCHELLPGGFQVQAVYSSTRHKHGQAGVGGWWVGRGWGWCSTNGNWLTMTPLGVNICFEMCLSLFENKLNEVHWVCHVPIKRWMLLTKIINNYQVGYEPHSIQITNDTKSPHKMWIVRSSPFYMNCHK